MPASSLLSGQAIGNPRWFVLVLVLSVGQILIQNTVKMQDWHFDEAAVSLRNHTYLSAESEAQLKEAYFSKDKSLALALYQRSTPDYLPSIKKPRRTSTICTGKKSLKRMIAWQNRRKREAYFTLAR